ncbi:pheromone autoinducer 2 transporter [uncultured Clostridium sp.]|uniref:AI-2E family transporter n=1 Tax=uncultured Clostridium sp. TaxID=59620 RepID=UPI00082233BD|nr:AI-2E family transporter [uncultured Clostridium sp.]SCJ93669.1 pheromone autoinducer 2 transporter [uncultured Clostridium sp.]
MIDKLKNDKFYIKYGIIIIFIAIVVVLAVKTITNGEELLQWIIRVVKKFISIIAPVIYAFLIAYLLYQPIKFIEKYLGKKIESRNRKNKDYSKLIRALSISIVFIVTIIVIIMVYNYLIPPILQNIKNIITSLPEFQEKLIIWVNEAVERLNSKNIDIENTGKLSKEIIDKIALISEKILGSVVSVLSNLSSLVVNFVVTVILVIYFLIYKEALVRQIKKVRDVLLPKRVGEALTIFLNDLDNIVGRFLVGEILDSVVVGIVSTVLLLIIKHPFAVLIGFIAGITNVIPYVGPIIGAALAFFFGVFTSLPLGIMGAVLLLLYQQIDGNLVQPKIVGDQIGLSPVWILIAVLIGGSYFGALGMILSMPIAGLMRVYFNRYAIYKSEKNK